MPQPRVLILHNQPVLPKDHPDAESEREVLDVVEFVEEYLSDAGLGCARLPVSYDPVVLLDGLREHTPDVVFNLFEGTGDDGSSEAAVACLLEWLGVPFTGCPSQAIVVARDKPLAKRLLRQAGLATPDFEVIASTPVPGCSLDWPVIVKLAGQDASVGLDQGSVISDPKRFHDRVSALLEQYREPVLVEKFIPGREFNVGIIEIPALKSLPVAEIEFVNKNGGFWPIVTYDAKWKVGSIDDIATPPCCPAKIAPELSATLQEMALSAFRQLGCRDYARVDFRVSPEGDPFILEVNPNPDFHPTCGFARGLWAAGLSHAQFAVDMVHAALARHHGDAARLLTSRASHRLN
jgi:D-alanine-D-alanine ligase